jgi:glyoxylase-like metal-dependent hydrolase (beta-lactamase superfamily II)
MGRMRLHVLDLGRMRMDSRVLVRADDRPFPKQVEIPISAYCIEHPEGRVLFDAGCHPEALGPNGRWSQQFQREYPMITGEECSLPNRLEQLGLRPDDFAHVVLSHLHSDHAGCVEFFRKSRIIVHADELAGAKDAYRRHDDDVYAWRDTDAWLKADLDWHAISGDRALHVGVDILSLGRGHAFGMLALAVALPETGRIILASDAAYCAENLTGAMPGWVLDEAAYRRTLARLNTLGGEIWFGHDPRQFATLRTSADGWYE